jgi:leucyl aminopeptidase
MKINIQLTPTIPENIKEIATQFKFEAKNQQYFFEQSTNTLYIGTQYESNPVEISEFDKTLFSNLGASVVKYIPETTSEIVILDSEYSVKDLTNFVIALRSSFFKFTYKDKVKVKSISVTSIKKLNQRYIDSVIEGIYFTKKVVDMNPYELNPTSYVELLKQEFASTKPWISFKVLENSELQELGMNMITAVGRGSEHGAKLFIVEMSPSQVTEHLPSTTLLVGKGLTFDTGGVNIKENGASFGMQDDMGGSATILGIAKTLSLMDQPKYKKIVFIAGIVENVTDGKSFMPGEILENIAGQTAIIKNTDAEGRLALSDALAYGVINYRPSEIITMATLTGAAIGSFTGFSSPLLSNNRTLRSAIFNQFLSNEEECVEVDMPSKVFRTGIKDSTGRSDMSNTGSYPPVAGIKGAGSQTAAAFVIAAAQPKLYNKNKEGLPDSIPVVHIDIAGTAVDSVGNGTAYGIKSIVDYLIK